MHGARDYLAIGGVSIMGDSMDDGTLPTFVSYRQSKDSMKGETMSWSTFKFVLLAIGTVFVASSDAKMVWVQDEDPDARRRSHQRIDRFVEQDGGVLP